METIRFQELVTSNLKLSSYKIGFQQHLLVIKDEVQLLCYSLELTKRGNIALGASKIHSRCDTLRSSSTG